MRLRALFALGLARASFTSAKGPASQQRSYSSSALRRAARRPLRKAMTAGRVARDLSAKHSFPESLCLLPARENADGCTHCRQARRAIADIRGQLFGADAGRCQMQCIDARL